VRREKRIKSRGLRFGLVASALLILCGCQNVGPIAIDAGRDHYNSALHSTGKVQTLSNIVRVFNHDSTAFMDVTEVDATTTLTGVANGTVTGIGSKPGTFGTLGSVTSGVTYTEAPLIRYVPLVGQGLVAQMVRPLTVDAIESLITSNWPTVAVLDLTALSLTADQDDSFAALNIISSLANSNNVMLVAGKSELTNPQDPSRLIASANNSGANKTPPANDALMIFQRHSRQRDIIGTEPGRNQRLWEKLWSIYSSSQRDCAAQRVCLRNSIELRTAPVSPVKAKTNFVGVPLLKTYSGIGILKNSTEKPVPKISVVSREKYGVIRQYDWDGTSQKLGFYTLLPDDEEYDDNPEFKPGEELGKLNLNEEIKSWITAKSSVREDKLMVYEPAGPRRSSRDFIFGNRRLGTLRRYVLIICDEVVPSNAYAAYPYEGRWYYIDGSDAISQRNFNLISLLLTVMSVPQTTTPITTSINAGGG
jgi:hypothetical protein